MIFLYNSTGLTLEKIIKNVFQYRTSLLLAKKKASQNPAAVDFELELEQSPFSTCLYGIR